MKNVLRWTIDIHDHNFVFSFPQVNMHYFVLSPPPPSPPNALILYIITHIIVYITEEQFYCIEISKQKFV